MYHNFLYLNINVVIKLACGLAQKLVTKTFGHVCHLSDTCLQLNCKTNIEVLYCKADIDIVLKYNTEKKDIELLIEGETIGLECW